MMILKQKTATNQNDQVLSYCYIKKDENLTKSRIMSARGKGWDRTTRSSLSLARLHSLLDKSALRALYLLYKTGRVCFVTIPILNYTVKPALSQYCMAGMLSVL